MKGLLHLFNWVAAGFINGLCPGGALVDNLAEELRRYRESATKIAEAMQKAWEESLHTLEMALGGKEWLAPKSRKQFAEKFAKEVITPFGVKNDLTGAKLEGFLRRALEQCQAIGKMGTKIIDFRQYDEETLLGALSAGSAGTSAEEIGVFIIDRIQTQIPNAKELLELLWYRNLLLEGMVAYFNFSISQNTALADLVGRMDRQRIQQELGEIKESLALALKSDNLAEVAQLGRLTTQLGTAREVYQIQENYQTMFGAVFERFDGLTEDHKEIKEKLDEVLSMVKELQQVQKHRPHDSKIRPEFMVAAPNVAELQMVDKINTLVKSVGWQKLPEPERALTVNSLAVGYYSSQKLFQSLAVLEDAIDHQVKNAEVYFNYFHVLQALERYPEAVDAYNQAVRLEPALALFPPDKYRMLEVLGRGGMGIVYKALWLEKEAPVAVKLLMLSQECYRGGAKERFLQAAEVAKTLKHPNIVLVHHADTHQGEYPYIVMEHVDGIDLEEKVKRDGAFPLEKGMNLARAIAAGLGYAHRQGVIHRDLKPGNIMLTASQEIKIIDFGLAKWQKDTALTLSGEGYYTIYYSAPEQRLDFHRADQKSDIYSFGKTLYYLFTGDEPYDIDKDDVPEQVWPVLHKAIRKNPEHRYATVEEMMEALEKAVSGNLEDDNGNGFWESDFFAAVDVAVQPPPACDIKNLHIKGVDIDHGRIISKQDDAPMVYVPAGPFLMGDESDRADYDECPIHEVYLDAYLIDVYPITNARYQMFLEALEKEGENAKHWYHPDQPADKLHIPQFWYSDKWNQPEHPVVGVDWWDAYAYSKWAEKELPTEAEWEKAARGTDGRPYPWGRELPTAAICNFNKTYNQTTAVTRFPNDQAPYGCSNMAGNVWEWCFDWFDPTYYRYSPKENPKGPALGRSRVGRGGSWMNDARRLRTTTRAYGSSPNDRNHHLGFRAIKRL